MIPELKSLFLTLEASALCGIGQRLFLSPFGSLEKK
jgi:hypothetical protein